MSSNRLFIFGIVLAVCLSLSCNKKAADSIIRPDTDPRAQLPSGAVVWETFNNTLADTLNSLNALCNGNVSFFSGKVGNAFEFDGYSACSIASNALLDIRGSLTVVCWIKLDTALAKQPAYAYYSDYPFIVGKGNGAYTQRNYGLYFDEPRNLLLFNAIDTSNTTYVFSVIIPSAGNYFDDLQWHLVAAVWDRAQLKASVYVDGNVVGSTTGHDWPLATNTYPLMIGAGDVGSYMLYGGIDELMLFTRALSSSEIGKIFAADSNGCRM